jgi:hypothetical protein
LIVAPIAYRRSWLLKGTTQGRVNRYEKGTRQHVQVLAEVGVKTKTGFIPWGPVVLSCKGFQAKNLASAFSKWEEHTAPLRTQLAKGIPAWLFWAAIGTFGTDRVQDMVGSGQNTSPITPIGPYLSPITETTLKMLYGGEALAKLIVDYRKQAEQWAHAWDQGADEPVTPNKDSRYESVSNPVADELDIPF